MNKLNSERDFLALIDTYFPSKNGHVTLGRGDDCSILKTNRDLCITKDLFIEDVHFRRSYFSPADIGYKSLAVNISDIAAMGGIPKAFALGLIVPDGLDKNYWDSLLKEMSSLANNHGIILAGGDLCKGPSLGISVTIWGEPEDRFLTRGNAEPGDILFIHGSLGLARTGLLSLEENAAIASQNYPKSVQAHLRPKIRINTGKALSASPAVTGLMDLSDGLARDLPRFINCCKTAFGAEITISPEQLHTEVIKFATAKNISPATHAFQGGEDYALFGAATADQFQELLNTVPDITRIGILTEKKEITLNGTIYSEKGFDHFSK